MKRKIRVNSCVSWAKLFFSGALSQDLRDVEIHKIGVMKNNRFDRALDLVAFVAVSGNDVQHFARNAMLVGKRDATERVPHLLPEFALDHIARLVLSVLQRFAYIRQESTGNEMVALNRDP